MLDDSRDGPRDRSTAQTGKVWGLENLSWAACVSDGMARVGACVQDREIGTERECVCVCVWVSDGTVRKVSKVCV